MKAERKLLAASFLLFLFILASGCAVGNKYNYRDVAADISASGAKTVSLATHDQREYVTSGKKAPDFIGLQRGGFGNPFNVSTESGKPLADDMTASITASLAKKGFKAVPVIVLYSENTASAYEKLKKTGAETLVLLTLNEWKSDTYNNVALNYDITLRILGKDGSTIAEKNIKGRDDLGGSFLNPPAHAKKAVPEAFGKKIEELFNSPEIARALQ